MIARALIDQALVLLRGAQRIVCVCHRNPDGDALGSLTAACQILRRELQKTVVPVCVDPAPPPFSFFRLQMLSNRP